MKENNRSILKFMLYVTLLFVFFISLSSCGDRVVDTSSETKNNNAMIEESLSDDLVVEYLPVDASWEPIEGGETAEAVVANSSIVVKGKITGQLTELRGEKTALPLVFTISTVDVSEIYAIDKSDSIDDIHSTKKLVSLSVLQTGGKKGEYNTPFFKDAPSLEFGKEYLLFLDNTGEGTYIPVGGRLGVANIIDGKIFFVNDESAELFSGIEYEKISELPDALENYVDNSPAEVDSQIVVNSENESVKEFLAGNY